MDKISFRWPYYSFQISLAYFLTTWVPKSSKFWPLSNFLSKEVFLNPTLKTAMIPLFRILPMTLFLPNIMGFSMSSPFHTSLWSSSNIVNHQLILLFPFYNLLILLPLLLQLLPPPSVKISIWGSPSGRWPYAFFSIRFLILFAYLYQDDSCVYFEYLPLTCNSA